MARPELRCLDPATRTRRSHRGHRPVRTARSPRWPRAHPGIHRGLPPPSRPVRPAHPTARPHLAHAVRTTPGSGCARPHPAQPRRRGLRPGHPRTRAATRGRVCRPVPARVPTSGRFPPPHRRRPAPESRGSRRGGRPHRGRPRRRQHPVGHRHPPRHHHRKEPALVRLLASRQLVVRLRRPRLPDLRQGRRQRTLPQGSVRTVPPAPRHHRVPDPRPRPRQTRGSHHGDRGTNAARHSRRLRAFPGGTARHVHARRRIRGQPLRLRTRRRGQAHPDLLGRTWPPLHRLLAHLPAVQGLRETRRLHPRPSRHQRRRPRRHLHPLRRRPHHGPGRGTPRGRRARLRLRPDPLLQGHQWRRSRRCAPHPLLRIWRRRHPPTRQLHQPRTRWQPLVHPRPARHVPCRNPLGHRTPRPLRRLAPPPWIAPSRRILRRRHGRRQLLGRRLRRLWPGLPQVRRPSPRLLDHAWHGPGRQPHRRRLHHLRRRLVLQHPGPISPARRPLRNLPQDHLPRHRRHTCPARRPPGLCAHRWLLWCRRGSPSLRGRRRGFQDHPTSAPPQVFQRRLPPCGRQRRTRRCHLHRRLVQPFDRPLPDQLRRPKARQDPRPHLAFVRQGSPSGPPARPGLHVAGRAARPTQVARTLDALPGQAPPLRWVPCQRGRRGRRLAGCPARFHPGHRTSPA